MRAARLPALLAIAVAAAGCAQILGLQDPSTGTDDAATADAPPGTADAPSTDAPPGTADGPMSTIDASAIDASVIDAPPSSGLGKVCMMSSDCTAPTTDCIQLQTSGAMFCSLTCGTTQNTTPPSGGDAICQNAYGSGLPGTPVCGAYGMMGSDYIWVCVISCPMNECPAGLTCTSGACV